jgi:hypothetical protein
MGNPMVIKVVKRFPDGGGTQPYYSVKYPDGTYMGRFGDVNALRIALME